MVQRPRLWMIIASAFTLLNLGGGVFAIAEGEPLHTTGHIALMLIGAFFVRRFAVRSSQPVTANISLPDERLENLQQSLDAIAIDLERIGEHQRFITKIAAERAGLPSEQAHQNLGG